MHMQALQVHEWIHPCGGSHTDKGARPWKTVNVSLP